MIPIENPAIEAMVLKELSETKAPRSDRLTIQLTLAASEAMREADHKAQEFKGDLTFRDFSGYPGELMAAIDAGTCDGVVSFHRLRRPGETDERIGMMAGGLTSGQTFSIICKARRMLMLMLGLSDAEPIGEAVQEQETEQPAPDVQPMRCSRCGIDHWGVLDKCPYMGCPHGLFR